MDYKNIFVDKSRVEAFRNENIRQIFDDIIDIFMNHFNHKDNLRNLYWEAAPYTCDLKVINPYRFYNFCDRGNTPYLRFPYAKGAMFVGADLSEHPIVHIMVMVPYKNIIVSIMFWSVSTILPYPYFVNIETV